MTDRRRPAARALAGAALLLPSATAGAQVLASERAVITQVVNGATVTVEYYRPAVRGRTVFGGLVKWGETWTPGANWATTLETDRDLRVEGQPLPKGRYAVWLTPRQDGAWTIGFSQPARRFHHATPRASAYVLRVPVRPEAAVATERLTWAFPAVARDSAVLQLQWATTAVPLHLGFVRPPAPTLTAAEAAAYAGRYALRFDGDSARTYALRVYAVPGGLEAMLDSAAAPPDLGPRMALVPADSAGAPHRFLWGTFQGGQYIGVEENLFWVFTVAGGRATAVEALDTNGDVVYARGARVPDAPPARGRRRGG